MVPLNIHLRGDELAATINHSDAKLIVVHDSLYGFYSCVENELKNIEHKIWHSESASPPNSFYSLNTLIESAREEYIPSVDIKNVDLLGIIYTQGTTGSPKGVMISHLNYWNAGNVWAKDIIDYREDDIMFSTLPLFHANAQMCAVMGCLVSGHPYVLGEGFSPPHFFDDVRRYGATVLHLVGSMARMLINQPKKEDDSHNPARIAASTAIPREIWQNFEKRFNLTIIEGYGLTETAGICISNTENNTKSASIGKPVRFYEVTICDGNTREVPIGQTGEIVVKEKIPYSLFLGYHKQTDKTKEAWKGGWFHTGDRGYEDETGYFYFVDRIQDCIRRNEGYISSFEIEIAANSHPKVLESAAVAVSSEPGRDDIKLYVVLKPDEELEPEEMTSFCEERLAYYMVPQYVEFIQELPKTATQRIQKFELRKRGVGNAWKRGKEGIYNKSVR